MRKLSNKDAARALKAGLVLQLNLGDVVSMLGMTAEEFLPYLQSGDITAYEHPDGEVTLRSDDLIDWMARHGRHLVRRNS